MSASHGGSTADHQVLVNQAGQHSLWPLAAAIPAGWQSVFSGTRQDAVAHVAAHWTDMRPHAAHAAFDHPAPANLVTEWNRTAHAVGLSDVVAGIEATAARVPDATAVIAADETLTYAELNSRANRLARTLIAYGIGPETRVAVALPRTANLVAALLAVLKSGAAYIPLDIAHPAERIAMILEDAEPRLVITVTEARDTVSGTRAPVLLLDSSPFPEPGSAVSSSYAEADPSNAERTAPLQGTTPAYIIFTSGSTGRPKGVVIEHRALANFFAAMVDRLALTEADRMLAVTTVGFDIAALELYLPLLVGATVVIAGQDYIQDADRLGDLIRREGVSVAQATPSLWRMLVTACPDALAKIRVLTGGEALPPALADSLARAAVSVTNLYGPTETTIWSTAEDVAENVAPGIGMPIWNTTTHVLNDRLAEVSPGEEGELFLGGDGLARGYLGRPDLTAERFVADPFGRFGARIYRTGDLVRRRTDGSLEYLGRADHQLKIRGHRIEPSEIEQVLEAHPAVARAAVCPIEGAHTELAALVVPAKTATVTDRDLRAFVGERLPPAFVPSLYVWGDAVPLGSTGKTDRAAVARAVAERLDVEHKGDSGNGDTLKAFWTEAVGADADETTGFLSAGGHSLAAARIIGAVKEHFGVRLPFALFLGDDITLAQLREAVQEHPANETSAKTATGDRAVLPDSLPLPPSLRRLWLLEQLNPSAQAAYNVVSAAEVPLSGAALDVTALNNALAAVHTRHDALRVTVDLAGSGQFEDGGAEAPTLRFASPGDLSPGVEVHDSAGPWAPGNFARECACLPVRQDGPMLRAFLLRGPDKACVVLALNHLIADQRAAEILLGELLHLWLDPGAPLPAAPSLRTHILGELSRGDDDRTADLEFWRTELAGAPTSINLPLRGPRPAIASHRAVVRARRVPVALLAAVDSAAATLSTTRAGFLLSCFAALLHSWSGQDDITIGVPADARREAAEQNLVAMAVDTLVIRSRSTRDSMLSDVVCACRDAFLRAADHTGTPFDAIVEALGIPTVAGRNPLFQCWFNDLTGTGRVRTPSSAARALPVPVASALFDLGLYLRRDGDDLEIVVAGAEDLFGETVVEEFARQYMALLAEATASPGTPLAELALADRARQHGEPPAGDVPAPASSRHDGRLWQALAALPAADPGTAAVIGASGTLSRSEQAASVRRLARALRRHGASPGVTVAIWARADPHLPTALLAVWHTGATIALIPADAPMRHREKCLSAVGASLALDPADTPDPGVLSVEDLLEEELEGSAGRAARNSARETSAFPEGGANDVWLGPGETSHVLFTSGTTGDPVGVLVGPEALAETLDWYVDAFGVGSTDRFALLSGPAHDPVLRDILVPLITGATLCVPPPRLAQRPDLLFAWLIDSGVTILHATPGLLDLVAAGADGRRLTSLRQIICGGDSLTIGHLRRTRTFTEASVTNVYGATETPQIAARATVLAAGERPGEDLPDHQVLPVGHGVAGRAVYPATPGGRPLAPGQRGEVLVRGRHLALGYLSGTRRADRFADAPDSSDDRIYRTGDAGYLTPGGEVVVTGRLDRQVSLGGHRVELSGVEAVALSFTGVATARATLQETPIGPVLALAVGGPGGRDVDTAALRTHLRARLPRYALPTVISSGGHALVLDTNHKWRATDGTSVGPGLPAGRIAETTQTRRPAPPRVAATQRTVRLLQDLVSEVLGHQIPPESNFFDAGLTSLTLLRLHQKITSRLGATVPTTALFTHPSIGVLAELLESIEGKESS
ncbi:amino acid adenylation domain-containing protein [Streptomyces sp. NPDC006372]|uniref:amino acid adenylation domain-containing protein n=1 Tax=Streptomyces sp. NPDC006372 TaxID=3155599 RepID=UPI0033A61457